MNMATTGTVQRDDAVREVGWEIERKIAASEKRAEKRKTK
jgi:PDZ domain-containing secreted protein